jgi:hypothetical protein
LAYLLDRYYWHEMDKDVHEGKPEEKEG